MNKPTIKISRSTYKRYEKDFKEGDDEMNVVIDDSLSDEDFIVTGKVVDFFGEPTDEKPINKNPCQSNKSDRKRNRQNRWR